MMLNPNEAGAFWHFMDFVDGNTEGDYRLKLEDGRMLDCRYFTTCQSENCLDLDDPDYEEYWIVCFKDKNSDYVHEVNYHCVPLEVWYNGEKVDLTRSYGNFDDVTGKNPPSES